MVFPNTDNPLVDSCAPLLSGYSRSFSNSLVDVEDDPRWCAVQRILSSNTFAKTPRLSGFFSYVAERTLLGRLDEISEQQIGVHVFGRPTNYNPGDDNIVRQTARQLRQRLALYYQEEGREESMLISIPRGGYALRFETTLSTAPSKKSFPAMSAPNDIPGTLLKTSPDGTVPDIEVAPAVPLVSPKTIFRQWPIFCFGILLGLALMMLGSWIWRQHHLKASNTAAPNKLWATLMRPDQKTLVVLGDAGLNMYDNLARREVGIEEYSVHTYLRTPAAETPKGFTWAPFATRGYISFSDLVIVTKLLELPGARPDRFDFRFARNIRLSDLENSNAILIGAPNYNPWIHAFDKSLDLQMNYDGVRNTITIRDVVPQIGEKSTYTWIPSDPNRTGYALISLTDNVQATGRVLLIEGTTMDGIEAAKEFLFNPQQLDSIIRKAEDRQGTLLNFELLLETTFYDGGSMRAKVVAFHVHPPGQVKSTPPNR
jgi:hypothetical protein